ncbi:PREDICTED: testis-expressed sequence 13A protein-like [Elephantulus edwardii]|uniref:testis-expressed sequence 13A protein-like n=1 Tax=Elephantulus edwardii TaxID=28737 RepID=UPI0003F07D9F|nr:PREDICTED: testis-expressed sequence 13A protein-like [Elephantulus edwardii]
MAINLKDTSSGFRHMVVVMFINEEVLKNGGRSDFYSACRSLHWPEVENRLQAILGDPRLPRSTKRVCAWSTLALGVRFAARQQAKQKHRIKKLESQVVKSEWTLAMELQRMQKEQEELTVQFRHTLDDLQQSLEERQVILRRLFESGKSAQGVVRENQAKKQWTNRSPHESMEQGVMVAVGGKGICGAWAQTSKSGPPLPVRSPEALGKGHKSLFAIVLHPYSYPARFSMACPYSPS